MEKHGMEVIDMLWAEYTMEDAMEAKFEEGFEEGEKIGETKGEQKIVDLLKSGMSPEEIINKYG